jgi:ADP-ribosylglycohydrolase
LKKKTGEEENIMDERAKASVMAAFAADALALGPHWIYDPEQIKKLFGRVETLQKPHSRSFHKNRDKGEFTHYGDQMLVLLESVAEKGAFDLSDFSGRWRKLFADSDGYFDTATRNTLANYKNGKDPETAGSTSDELSGAARIAPLVCCYRDDPEALARMAVAQTRMTHMDDSTVASAAYFARVTQAVLTGETPLAAMKSVAEDHFDISPVSAWLQKGLASTGRDSITVINDFGASCHTGEMFPGVVHLIARYENDLKEALVHCVMAGGDSAARGALVGMVLGANLGLESLPKEWITEMKAAEKIERLLARIF